MLPLSLSLSLSFAFRDVNFCLSSQLKAASCASCNSEMPPSKQVNGHSFTICLIIRGLVFTAVAEGRGEIIPIHACCLGMVPYLFGTCLAGYIGHGASSGTSAIWACHILWQRCGMVSASSGMFDHIGRLDFSHGQDTVRREHEVKASFRRVLGYFDNTLTSEG